jgi:hypothetical protein
MLRPIVPKQPSVLLYADHVEQFDINLYRLLASTTWKASRRSAEGVYGGSWFKIRNPVHSQYEGRRELFENRFFFIGPDKAEVTMRLGPGLLLRLTDAGGAAVFAMF